MISINGLHQAVLKVMTLTYCLCTESVDYGKLSQPKRKPNYVSLIMSDDIRYMITLTYFNVSLSYWLS